jgi:hypothetical protein
MKYVSRKESRDFVFSRKKKGSEADNETLFLQTNQKTCTHAQDKTKAQDHSSKPLRQNQSIKLPKNEDTEKKKQALIPRSPPSHYDTASTSSLLRIFGRFLRSRRLSLRTR